MGIDVDDESNKWYPFVTGGGSLIMMLSFFFILTGALRRNQAIRIKKKIIIENAALSWYAKEHHNLFYKLIFGKIFWRTASILLSIITWLLFFSSLIITLIIIMGFISGSSKDSGSEWIGIIMAIIPLLLASPIFLWKHKTWKKFDKKMGIL